MAIPVGNVLVVTQSYKNHETAGNPNLHGNFMHVTIIQGGKVCWGR